MNDCAGLVQSLGCLALLALLKALMSSYTGEFPGLAQSLNRLALLHALLESSHVACNWNCDSAHLARTKAITFGAGVVGGLAAYHFLVKDDAGPTGGAVVSVMLCGMRCGK